MRTNWEHKVIVNTSIPWPGHGARDMGSLLPGGASLGLQRIVENYDFFIGFVLILHSGRDG